jgi:hypothetical protein
MQDNGTVNNSVRVLFGIFRLISAASLFIGFKPVQSFSLLYFT